MPERIYTVEEHGPRIDAFLKTVTRLAGLNLSWAVSAGESPHPDIEDPELVVRFSGRDLDGLLENKAELLLAFEHLTMEALRMPSEHHERVCFDANDYRMLRIAELRLSASTAAEKVKRTSQPFLFSPMTSRERRIIHLALRNDTDVRSESLGTGPFRQVVIYPAGMPSLPEPPRPPMGARPRPPGGGFDRGPGGPGGPGGGRDRGPRRDSRPGDRGPGPRDRGPGGGRDRGPRRGPR